MKLVGILLGLIFIFNNTHYPHSPPANHENTPTPRAFLLSSGYNFFLRRMKSEPIKPRPFSRMTLKLQWRLNSEDKIIEDEDLLVRDILTPLLQRDPAYEEKYTLKAKPLLLQIYEERYEGIRKHFPRGLFVGRQGEINLRIIIRYLIEEKYNWELDEHLPERVNNWAQWFRDNKLGAALNLHQGSPLKLLEIAYPENFWDPGNWEKPFLWFSHQFAPKNFWSNPANDEYARQLIRYFIQVREGWEVNAQLPSKVTQRWLRSVGLSGLLKTKFNFDHIALLKFAYPQEFSSGVLSSQGFKNLRPGLGVASVIHPPRIINPSAKSRKIDGVFYYFGKEYVGWLAGKLSRDYGGLFTPEGELAYIFPLIHPLTSNYINIPANNLLWEIPDFLYRAQNRTNLPLDENLELLKQCLGLSPLSLSLRERLALAAIIQSQGINQIKECYHLLEEAGDGWLKALANLPDYPIAFEILRDHSLEFCKRLFLNYGFIYKLIQEIKNLSTFPPGYLKERESFPPQFLGSLAALGNALAEYLLRLNNDALIMETTLAGSQEELLTFVLILREYLKREGNIIFSSYRQEDQETSIMHLTVVPLEYTLARTVTVRTRCYEHIYPPGIFFTIRGPGRSTLQFSIQRSFSSSRGQYFLKFSFQGKYFNGKDSSWTLSRGKHYLMLAQEETFANLVRAFRREINPSNL